MGFSFNRGCVSFLVLCQGEMPLMREYSFLHVNAPRETIVDRTSIVLGSSFDSDDGESRVW